MALDSLRKLFRYELLTSVPTGRGGCGRVWPARDLLFDRQVALKTIDDGLFWDAPEEAERTFKKEAAAGARLGELSRNIVKVFDMGRIDDVLYFSMEWIAAPIGERGIDISNLMGSCSLAKAKSIMLQVCDAVMLAHRNKIVHSDIAPWNIVYDAANGVFKLADFGLLKIMEERLLTRGSGSLLKGGRAAFQPLEVRLDSRQINYASDIFALAVTFRVLLEGDVSIRSGGSVVPTPSVLRMRHEQRDAPPQVVYLLSRFIDSHQSGDTIDDFVALLTKIPN